MNKSKKAFTLIELLISISISILIIFWFTTLYMNISESIVYSQRKVNILNDVKNFTTKLSYSTNLYNSWFIISQTDKFDTLILTNSGNLNWYIIWVFDCNNKTWVDIKLTQNNTIYDNNCFWYFPLKQTQISNIITDKQSIYNNSFNWWSIYSNIIVKSFKVSEFTPNHIFDLNLELFDYLYFDFISKNIDSLNYDYSKIIRINLNF